MDMPTRIKIMQVHILLTIFRGIITSRLYVEPLKTITTEIENGIITKTMTDVHPDDSKEGIYSAFEDLLY